MLAYLFWHWPAPHVDVDRYADAVVAFHGALAAAPTPGLQGSRVFAVDGAPWVVGEYTFEDWYFVDDFAALGVLNEAAISGTRREPHDAAARLAAGGAGGVYRRLAAGTLEPIDRATWLSKPPGMSYPDLLARLPPGEVWQRQMVLGPAPEFCLPGAAAPAGIDARTMVLRCLYVSSAGV